MSTSKERILRIVRLENELRAFPDSDLDQTIESLEPELRETLTQWCPLGEPIDIAGLRGSLTRGRLKGLPERVAGAITAQCLQDCIVALGDNADYPNVDDLEAVLDGLNARHGVRVTRLMFTLAVVSEAPASAAITKLLKTSPGLAIAPV